MWLGQWVIQHFCLRCFMYTYLLRYHLSFSDIYRLVVGILGLVSEPSRCGILPIFERQNEWLVAIIQRMGSASYILWQFCGSVTDTHSLASVASACNGLLPTVLKADTYLPIGLNLAITFPGNCYFSPCLVFRCTTSSAHIEFYLLCSNCLFTCLFLLLDCKFFDGWFLVLFAISTF